MRHAKKRLQLNRYTSWHKATLKSMARNILIYQSIRTTKAKAMATKPLVEKLITLAKTNTLAAKRRAYQILGDHRLVSRLFNEIGLRFSHRQGGYTRVINFDRRRGDNANMVIFELSEIIKTQIKKAKKIEEKAAEKPQTPALEPPKPKAESPVEKNKHLELKKTPKKFLGGIRNIFKKQRDSL